VTRAVLLLATLALLAAAAAASAPVTQPRPWLWQCAGIHLDEARDACYVRLLLQAVDRSGDPATELPRIDRRARAAGGDLYGRCHLLMHEVGRRWAAEHHLTLEHLQEVVPRSNDPGCSAGFGMGLVMYLGPQIVPTGGRSALATCVRLPTRYRRYTCVHSLGHALMRGYHETLWLAVRACVRLGKANAPDCAQGAFHDYWISLRGADGTVSPVHAVRSPRVLCRRYARFALGCWYRTFVERAPAPALQTGADVERTCRGLAGAQRQGCVAGASLALGLAPLEQTRLCGRLPGSDALSCLRGVGVQATAGHPAQQAALLAACRGFAARDRDGCVSWFGLTLQLVTNGRFAREGCPRLPADQRRACAAGARRARGPIVTFS
jgi:hypothetical protein